MQIHAIILERMEYYFYLAWYISRLPLRPVSLSGSKEQLAIERSCERLWLAISSHEQLEAIGSGYE